MSLNDVWEAASGNPFYPTVSKERQFFVGFTLLLAAILLAGFFGLNLSAKSHQSILIAIPASLAFGFGAVYMICAVGVYV